MATPPVRLRPLALSDFLDEIIRVYRGHFVLLAGLALLVQLPTVLFAIAFGARFATLFSAAPSTGPSPVQMQAAFTDPLFLGALGLAGLVTLVAYPFLYGTLIKAAVDAVEGRPATLGSVLAAVARRYFAIWVLGIVEGAAIIALLLTCVGIPVAIWIAIRWILAGPVLFSENAGPIQALGRSWRLTKNAWWRTFGMLLLVWLMVSIIGGGLGYIGQVAGLLAPNPILAVVLQLVASAVLQTFTQPIVILFLVLLYLDRRVRGEAAELDQLAYAAAGAQPGTAYEPPPPGHGAPQPPPPPPAAPQR